MHTFVTAVFKARPGKGDRLLELFRGLVEPTHKDAGCLSYALNRDQDDPERLVFMEEWESREALNAHLDTDHIKSAFATVEKEDLVASQDIIALERVAGGDVKA